MGISAWGGSRTRGIPGVTQAETAGGVEEIIAVIACRSSFVIFDYLSLCRIRAAICWLLFASAKKNNLSFFLLTTHLVFVSTEFKEYVDSKMKVTQK